jgi:hypothetical protein
MTFIFLQNLTPGTPQVYVQKRTHQKPTLITKPAFSFGCFSYLDLLQVLLTVRVRDMLISISALTLRGTTGEILKKNESHRLSPRETQSDSVFNADSEYHVHST